MYSTYSSRGVNCSVYDSQERVKYIAYCSGGDGNSSISAPLQKGSHVIGRDNNYSDIFYTLYYYGLK